MLTDELTASRKLRGPGRTRFPFSRLHGGPAQRPGMLTWNLLCRSISGRLPYRASCVMRFETSVFDRTLSAALDCPWRHLISTATSKEGR